jgi:hypothetical protein
MRFELTTSTLAISADLMTPFGKFSNINHNVSRGVACRPVMSRGKWKVEWKEDKDFERRLSSPTESTGTAGVVSGNDRCAVRPAGETP